MAILSFTSLLWSTVVGYIAYRILWQGVVYNLFLHPLAAFPGPRAAALTEWWKTYVEVFRGESLVHVLVGLHGEYGLWIFVPLSWGFLLLLIFLFGGFDMFVVRRGLYFDFI